MKIILVAAVIASMLGANNLPIPQLAYAFCLWNCDAQKVKESGPLFLDCQRFQYDNGQYSYITKYGDVTKDGKVKSWVDGTMITEDELKKEWKEHPEAYEHDCHNIHDLTPQLMEKMYQESLK